LKGLNTGHTNRANQWNRWIIVYENKIYNSYDIDETLDVSW